MLWTQNYYSCRNKTIAYATIIILWTQIRKYCGNKKVGEAKKKYFEDAKISIVLVQEQKKTHSLMIPMFFLTM